jgi:hypothetical protein
MGEPFIGSEAIASGRVTPYELRTRFVAMHHDVYLPAEAEVTAATRAKAAWLWSRRSGVIAGQSAAAVHGAKWVEAGAPAQIIYDNRHPPTGIHTWADRFDDDEVELVDGMFVTTPARTALVDAGAESPRETWLRLLLIRAGFPRPQTQIPVYNEYRILVAVLDMGWEDVKVAADYEGDHHRTRSRFNKDIRRHEEVTELGWIDVRVTSQDTEAGIVRRVKAAWDRRK